MNKELRLADNFSAKAEFLDRMIPVFVKFFAYAEVHSEIQIRIRIQEFKFESEFENWNTNSKILIQIRKFEFKFRLKNAALNYLLEVSDLKVSACQTRDDARKYSMYSIKWDIESQCDLHVLLWYMNIDTR